MMPIVAKHSLYLLATANKDSHVLVLLRLSRNKFFLRFSSLRQLLPIRRHGLMGRNKPLKYIPKKLGTKLRQIREGLGLTQEEMLKLLDLPSVVTQSTISAYERNAKLPPYFVLARYGDVANVWIDVLVRDSLDLPARIPSINKTKHSGIEAE